jgi:CRP-like cAMP-binding protein
MNVRKQSILATSIKGRNNSVATAATLHTAASWELSDNTKEEKKIAMLAKKNPPDYQVSNLLEIDFSSRKINFGEKDMLLRGVKLEKQGDLKAAISCYTNAGAHSKDQQISRMLLGNLHYRVGHLMTSLKFYTIAIQLLEMKTDSLRSPHDCYLAYYNRAIINFRLGADELGLEDLEKAKKVNPSDISIHELLSLAKRRVGKYMEAIDEAIVSETHRQEKKKKDLLKAIEQAKLLQERELHQEDGEEEEEYDNREKGQGDEDGELRILLPSAIIARKKQESSKQHIKLAAIPAGGSRKISYANAIFNALTGPNNRIASSGRKMSKSETSQSSSRGSSSRLLLHASRSGLKGGMNNEDITGGTGGDRGLTSNTAAIAMRRDEYFKNLSPTKGLILHIPSSSCQSSLKDRVIEGKRIMKGESLGGEEDSGNALKSFKMKNEIKPELFHELFLKPNPLQESLIIAPNHRLPSHLQLIIDTLRQFPYTSSLSSSALHELSSVIEYRVLHSKEDLFNQNDDAGALMFLMKGTVEMKMDASLHTSMLDISLGNVKEHSVFGHVDLLFRHPRPQFKKAIEDILIQSIEHSSLWDNKPSFLTTSSTVSGGGAGSLVHHSNSHVTGGVPPASSGHNEIGGGIQRQNSGLLDAKDSLLSGPSKAMDDALSLSTERVIDNDGFLKQIHQFMNHWNAYEENQKEKTYQRMNDRRRDRAGSASSPLSHQSHSPDKEKEKEKEKEKDFQLSRALSPGMFMTYHMQSPCELLMLCERDFQRILYDYVVNEFMIRLKGILSSGIFKGWKPEELIRLARMGQIISFKNGETIVKQGTKPSFIYIILKGMCKVVKKPNRTEILVQKLQESEEEANQHDRKYFFHHRVANNSLEDKAHIPYHTGAGAGEDEEGGGLDSRSTPLLTGSGGIGSAISSPCDSPIPPHLSSTQQRSSSAFPLSSPSLPSKVNSNGTKNGNGGFHNDLVAALTKEKSSVSSMSNKKASLKPKKPTKKLAFTSLEEMNEFPTTMILPPTKLTEAEQKRQETQTEINKLKALIHRAQLLDMMEETNAYQRRMTRLQQSLHRGSASSKSGQPHHLGLKQDIRSEDAKIQDLAYHLSNKYAEIKTIRWPMIFGEACILDPENGVSRGSVIADTGCEVLAIHKIQLQTFPIDEHFIDRVRSKKSYCFWLFFVYLFLFSVFSLSFSEICSLSS